LGEKSEGDFPGEKISQYGPFETCEHERTQLECWPLVGWIQRS
jgi:hypothetical protein